MTPSKIAVVITSRIQPRQRPIKAAMRIITKKHSLDVIYTDAPHHACQRVWLQCLKAGDLNIGGVHLQAGTYLCKYHTILPLTIKGF